MRRALPPQARTSTSGSSTSRRRERPHRETQGLPTTNFKDSEPGDATVGKVLALNPERTRGDYNTLQSVYRVAEFSSKSLRRRDGASGDLPAALVLATKLSALFPNILRDVKPQPYG